ncbi:hypothetical protein DFH07DRAFT_767523 [Mycena maculata]|uniref:Uncharacterized protein n=1 Tax=Mycena maculata TaxID=230809 RepID=A0AAD7JX33_9AGAR|nr:hypothetical protein DFH07DRAFT_767523 [Mycena maculata]
MQSAAEPNNQLTSYETLKTKQDAGVVDNKPSLECQEILQEVMNIDKHHSDLGALVNDVRKDIDAEKGLRLLLYAYIWYLLYLSFFPTNPLNVVLISWDSAPDSGSGRVPLPLFSYRLEAQRTASANE